MKASFEITMRFGLIVLFLTYNFRGHVIFSQKQRAVTPGQAIVFYRGSAMLGGGTIITASAVGTFLR